MMHGMDDRARTKEQQRLEKGMREQVVDAGRIHPDPERHEHVAELRTGRIRDHALDVVLHQAHRGAKKAVVAPTISTTLCANGANSKIGDRRATMNTPAVTMVAAWISAETGVGPSIASGSQVCSRNWPICPSHP